MIALYLLLAFILGLYVGSTHTFHALIRSHELDRAILPATDSPHANAEQDTPEPIARIRSPFKEHERSLADMEKDVI